MNMMIVIPPPFLITVQQRRRKVGQFRHLAEHFLQMVTFEDVLLQLKIPIATIRISRLERQIAQARCWFIGRFGLTQRLIDRFWKPHSAA